MKKYVFNQMQDVARLLGMATDNESNTVITIGAKAVENQLVCGFRSNSINRQISLRTVCTKPKEWDGTATQLVVNSSQLISTVQTLMSAYKDDKMYIQVGETDITLGVEGKAKVKLNLVSETPIEIRPGSMIAQFAVREGFDAFLRKGCGCAAQSSDTSRLLHNAVFVLNTETGELSAFSTDGFAMARSKTMVQMAKTQESESVQSALKAFCEAKSDTPQTPQALTLCIPSDSMNTIRNLVSGVKNVAFAADENHLWVQAGSNVMLCVTRGNGTGVNIKRMNDVIFGMQEDIVCAVDAEALTRGITLCNKVASMKGTPNVTIEVVKDAIKIYVGTGKTKEAETKVALLGKTGETVSVCATGKQVEALLNMLDKGGVVLSFVERKLLRFANGKLDSVDSASGMALTLMQPGEAQKEEEPKKTDAESADVNEGNEAELKTA